MLDINFSDFPVLYTERLKLRRISINDAPALLFLRSNDIVMHYVDSKKFKSIEESMELIGRIDDAYKQNNGISWTICYKDDDTMIGDVAFWRIIKEHHRAEFGYMLHHDHWHKGIMTEAIGAVISYGFNELRFHSIEANVNPSNINSIKLLERSGFVREAYFKENFYYDGKFLDSAIYSLLNPEN